MKYTPCFEVILNELNLSIPSLRMLYCQIYPLALDKRLDLTVHLLSCHNADTVYSQVALTERMVLVMGFALNCPNFFLSV